MQNILVFKPLMLPGVCGPVPLSHLLSRKTDIKRSLDLEREKSQVSLPLLIGFKKTVF